MILVPYSYNGTSLQSTDYATDIPRESAQLQMSTNPGYTRRAGAVPVFAGKDFQPVTMVLEIKMLHDTWTLFESINQLFDTKDETPRQLICTDSEDSNKQYYVYATAKEVMGGHDGPMATVTLALDDPIWQTVTQNSQTWTITGSTSTTDLTIGTNDEAYPIFEITPTSQPSTDFIYHRYVLVYPRSQYRWASRPICLTGDAGSFDTAALIAAGKMQADGDDIRVRLNGQDVDFWYPSTDVNTTDTRVWVVNDMPAKYNGILKTAIGATDTVTEIEFSYTDAAKQSLTAMPATGYVVVDSSIGATDTEAFSYTAKTITDTKLAVTINARAMGGTVAVAHAATTSNVRHCPYIYTIHYGNASVSAAVVSDARKPVLNLSTSLNSSFVYQSFGDNTGLRAGGWARNIRQVSNTNLSRSNFYSSTNDVSDTDPAAAMGIKALTYEANGAWQPDTVSIKWSGRFMDIVGSVSASGVQKQSVFNVPVAYLQQSSVNTQPNTVWSIALQTSTDYGTWTAWSKPTSDAAGTLAADAIYLNFALIGTMFSDTDASRYVELDTLTVGLTNYVHCQMATESANALTAACTIRNETTGEFFQLANLPILVGETITVDTDPDFPTVKLNGIVSNGAILLSSIRSRWLRLTSGANTLGFENGLSSANDYTIVIKYRERQNFF